MTALLSSRGGSRPGGAYLALNISFMAVAMAIMLYSAFYRCNNHPIPALLTQKTGIIPPSKGLSAGFSAIVQGNIAEALERNPHSVRIFSFFALQLLLRVAAVVALQRHWCPVGRMVAVDIGISAALFAVCFAPLIGFTLRLFAQLLQ